MTSHTGTQDKLAAGADNGESLFKGFDHYKMPLGPDGTPYQYLETLRDEVVATGRPINWSNAYGGFWVVGGWDESKAIHENTTDFSNVATTFPPYATPSGKPFFLSGQDEPEHGHYRKMVQAPFTRARAKAMLDQLRGIASKLVDLVADQDRFDICTATDLMPGYTFCAIVGLSMDDAPKFDRFVKAMVEGALDPEGSAATLAEMADYWSVLVKQRRAHPDEGLLSEIINSEYDGVKLTDEELLEFFSVLLLGGFDNTQRFLGNALYRLAWHQELRRRLVRHPELIPQAVNELLRLDGPACTFRLVRNPVLIGGVEMQPGQIAGLIHPLTNRDPRRFDYPDNFIIGRPSANRHLTFGLGIHHCLGAFLAHGEGVAFIEKFLERIPEFHLDVDRPAHWISGQVGGMHSVPVRICK